MATIVMTDQQLKLYVDNVFEKYDKDLSYTLDLLELSEFLNDLALARGSITLPSLKQVTNTLHALNPGGAEGITKQVLFTSLKRLNGSSQDLILALLQTMDNPEEMELLRNVSIPPGATLPTFNSEKILALPRTDSHHQLAIVDKTKQAPSSNSQMMTYSSPQPYKAELRQNLAPLPFQSYNNQNFHGYQHQVNYQQPQGNYLQRSVPVPPTYSNNAYYGQGQQQVYNQGVNVQQTPSAKVMGGVQQVSPFGVQTMGGHMGGGTVMGTQAMGGMPIPPFNPLAALSFFGM